MFWSAIFALLSGLPGSGGPAVDPGSVYTTGPERAASREIVISARVESAMRVVAADLNGQARAVARDFHSGDRINEAESAISISLGQGAAAVGRPLASISPALSLPSDRRASRLEHLQKLADLRSALQANLPVREKNQSSPGYRGLQLTAPECDHSGASPVFPPGSVEARAACSASNLAQAFRNHSIAFASGLVHTRRALSGSDHTRPVAGREAGFASVGVIDPADRAAPVRTGLRAANRSSSAAGAQKSWIALKTLRAARVDQRNRRDLQAHPIPGQIREFPEHLGLVSQGGRSVPGMFALTVAGRSRTSSSIGRHATIEGLQERSCSPSDASSAARLILLRAQGIVSAMPALGAFFFRRIWELRVSSCKRHPDSAPLSV